MFLEQKFVVEPRFIPPTISTFGALLFKQNLQAFAE